MIRYEAVLYGGRGKQVKLLKTDELNDALNYIDKHRLSKARSRLSITEENLSTKQTKRTYLAGGNIYAELFIINTSNSLLGLRMIEGED